MKNTFNDLKIRIKRIFFVFLIAFFYNVTFLKGQSYVLTGQVLDSMTKTPLKYAGIQVKNKVMGSVADQDGYFNIKNPLIQLQDTLEFSFIGYQNKVIAIKDILATKNIKILLATKADDLNEMSLSSNYTVADLIQEAVDAIPNNYYQDYTVYRRGHYMEIQQSQSKKKASKEVEAYITVKRPPIKKQELAHVIVEKARYDSRYIDIVEVHAKPLFLDNIDKDLLPDFLRNPKLKKVDYQLLGVEKCNGHDCYAITARNSKKTIKNGLIKFWIDTTSLAFVKFYEKKNYEFGQIPEDGNFYYKLQRFDLHKETERCYVKSENGKWILNTSKSYLKSYDKSFKDTLYTDLHYDVQEMLSSEEYAMPEGYYLGEKDSINKKAMLWDDPRWLEERKKTKLKK